MTNIAIAGAAGRMGRALIQALEHYPQLTLVGGLVEPGDPFNGTDLGLLASGVAANVVATDEFSAIDPAPQVLVDFTAPEATLENLRQCAQIGCACVIGTTGFSPEQLDEIDRISEQLPVMLAANYSLGVALCLRLLKESARVLGAESDIEIVEAHHRHKKDAPSGTALRMGEVVAESLGRKLDQVAVYGREGVGEPRDRETIGFATVRAGDIVGEHTVIFAADGERVEISHKASSRMTFARGAMRAAGWLVGKPAGRYDLEDLLAESE